MDFRNDNLYHLVLTKLRGLSLLDIGCGSGGFIFSAKERGFEPLGLEPDKAAVELSKKLYGPLNIIVGSADDIQKLGRRFDNLTMLDVLEHLEDDVAQIQENYRWLQERGRLVIVVPAFPLLYGIHDMNKKHFRRYKKKELIEKLEKNKFRVIEIRYWNAIGFLPYLISEKILKKELTTDLRSDSKKGKLKSAINKILNSWFKYVENKINFHFGLSIICVAEKIDDHSKHTSTE